LPILVAAMGKVPTGWPINSTNAHAAYAQISDHVTAIPGLPAAARVGMLELAQEQQRERWLATENFYALMSYNPRVYYATAVYRLSRAIADRYRQPQP
jgi:membrane-bound lytic murein transglycosylase B